MIESTLQQPSEEGHSASDLTSTLEKTGVTCSSEGDFPFHIYPQSGELQQMRGFLDWMSSNFGAIEQLLVRNGAILFRGFPVQSSQDFNAFLGLFEPFSLGYAGGASPRRKISGDVFEATQLAGPVTIPLHQEMAYTRDFPGRIAFYCRQPAERGGETVIADMRKVTNAIPQELCDKLEKLGVLNVRNFAAGSADPDAERADVHPDQRSWQFAFYTEDEVEVEATCAKKGMTPVWNEDGSLTVRASLDAFVTHPLTGQRVYRSLVHMGDLYGDDKVRADLPEEMKHRLDALIAKQVTRRGTFLGDGSTLSDNDKATFQTIYDAQLVNWSWQTNDILLLDNILVAHGRNPYEGRRDVQVGLLA